MTRFTPPPNFKLKTQWPCWVGSKPVHDMSDTLTVDNKYTHQQLASITKATPDMIRDAITCAHNSRKPMKELASYQRKQILLQVVEKVRERFDEFVYVLCLESGKPVKDAKGEVNRLIDTFDVAAGEATRIHGEYQSLDISERANGFEGIVRKFPVGVVSMISPWNFPLNLVAHKVAPAIAAGCPFVLKPASKTPLGALMLAEVLAECTHLPEGAFSVLPCSRDGADLLSTDERIQCISFTGSTDVGWKLKERSGKKKVVLELGGNAPCIVDKEVELNHVANRIVHGGFYQSGQSCISVQRVLAHEHIYDRLEEILIEKINALKVGDPLDEDTFIGPLISTNDAKRCYDWVQEAVQEGATVLCGGKEPNNNVFHPTLLSNVSPNSKVSKEEVFGPIVTLGKVECFKDAVDKANDSRYGLQAGVFSSNLHHCFYAYKNLEYGGIVINDVPSSRVDAMPYGGIKDSGIGREGVKDAIEEFSEPKIMLLHNVGQIGGVEQ